VTTPSSTMNTFTSSTVFRFLSTAKDEPSSLLPLLASRAPARTTRDGLGGLILWQPSSSASSPSTQAVTVHPSVHGWFGAATETAYEQHGRRRQAGTAWCCAREEQHDRPKMELDAKAVTNSFF
jgi:hypothetical protein